MKQKIVMKVWPITDDRKSRRKAMEIAASVEGATSVAVDSDKDLLVVIGDGVDTVELTRLLREKMGFTELISVGPVREKIEKKDEEGGGEKKDKGGGGEGEGGGGSEKKDKPDDSEKKDKEGGGRAGKKKDKASGEPRKMGGEQSVRRLVHVWAWYMCGGGPTRTKARRMLVDCSPLMKDGC